MAILEKAPPAALRPLAPSDSLKKAWQLLGYRRYLPRVSLSAGGLSAPAASIVPSEVAVSLSAAHQLKSQSKEAEFLDPALPDVPAAAVPDTAQTVLVRQGVSIIDHHDFTLLYTEKASLCLPPLWSSRDGHYQVFAHESECGFLRQVFNVMAMPDFAALLNALDAPLAQPRLSGKASGLKEWQALAPKATIIMGRFAALERALRESSEADAVFLSCTHPYLAMQSAADKKRLWLDLLNIKENLTL